MRGLRNSDGEDHGGLLRRSLKTNPPGFRRYGFFVTTAGAFLVARYGSPGERSSHIHTMMMADTPTITSAQMKET